MGVSIGGGLGPFRASYRLGRKRGGDGGGDAFAPIAIVVALVVVLLWLIGRTKYGLYWLAAIAVAVAITVYVVAVVLPEHQAREDGYYRCLAYGSDDREADKDRCAGLWGFGEDDRPPTTV